jgi:hypothetical protein
LSFKDDNFCHDEFVKSWNVLFEDEFVRQTFPTKARTVAKLVGRVSKLIMEMEKKTSSTSTVASTRLGMSGHSQLTSAQNMLWGSPKLMPQTEKSTRKHGGKVLKGYRIPT